VMRYFFRFDLFFGRGLFFGDAHQGGHLLFPSLFPNTIEGDTGNLLWINRVEYRILFCLL